MISMPRSFFHSLSVFLNGLRYSTDEDFAPIFLVLIPLGVGE